MSWKLIEILLSALKLNCKYCHCKNSLVSCIVVLWCDWFELVRWTPKMWNVYHIKWCISSQAATFWTRNYHHVKERIKDHNTSNFEVNFVCRTIMLENARQCGTVGKTKEKMCNPANEISLDPMKMQEITWKFKNSSFRIFENRRHQIWSCASKIWKNTVKHSRTENSSQNTVKHFVLKTQS